MDVNQVDLVWVGPKLLSWKISLITWWCRGTTSALQRHSSASSRQGLNMEVL